MAISKCSIRKAYSNIVTPTTLQHWSNAVWGRLRQPKHRFITWLAMLGRLNTKDRLLKIGVTTDNICLLCGTEMEGHRYLFCDCPYSSRSWHQIRLWVGIGFTRNLPELVNWLHKKKVTKFRKGVLYAIIMCTVYHIWREIKKQFIMECSSAQCR